MRDQFYLFLMPLDSVCPVWAEMYGSDGTHVVAPTPYGSIELAAAQLKAANPGATVDELCYETDIDECREWARTMPLEQIAA